MFPRRLPLRPISIVLVSFCLAFVLVVAVSADNGPHGGYSATTDACAGCHRTHTAPAARLLLAASPDLCFTCHGTTGTGADTNVMDGVYLERDGIVETPVEGAPNHGLKGGGFQQALMDTDVLTTTTAVLIPTTSSHIFDGSAGTAWGNGTIGSGPGAIGFGLSCVSCHDPHGSDAYRILRPIPTDSGAATTVTVTDETDKTYTVNDTDNFYISQNYGVQGSELAAWCSQCHTRYLASSGSGHTDSGDPIFTFRHSTINVSCVSCHVAHGSSATAVGYAGAVPWPDGSTIPNEDARSSLLRLDNRGVCYFCHFDADGNFGGACNACHGQPPATGSHTTHFNTSPIGPQITPGQCDDCHVFSGATHMNGQPTFADGNPLATTTVCDVCHSPGGAYNGTQAAKANWMSGVYAAGALEPGNELWCAGCHDESPAVIQSVLAPNVIGDEDAATRYGTGYGYYKTGHGLSSANLYPATGAYGAGLGCLDCHDSQMTHVDGIARTYAPDSDYLTYDPESANYQTGYRLKNVSTGYGGTYPMHIPRTGNVYPPGFREDWEFALCFQCHDSTGLLGPIGDPNTTTNFRDEQTSGSSWNSHDLHTDGRNGPWGPETPQYDSNFDGTADSRLSCPACHNVHGSPSPAMFRHGELAAPTSSVLNMIPFMDLQYVPLCVGNDCSTLAESTGGGGTRFYTPGAATIERNGVCNMCHNEYWFDGDNDGSSNTGYRRTPIILAFPKIAWVDGQVGSNTLLVRFTEGVYGNVGAVGALVPADFTLVDADNGRSITGVTHTAGDIMAYLTLSSPLDAADDIGADTLSPATAASIYNAAGNAAATTPATISGDAVPPSLTAQNPPDGAANIAVNSNLAFTLSDAESGVNWTTFSIALAGDQGYSQTYTDADTAVVSVAGTPGSYSITVNPAADFGAGENINVIVNIDDLAGNSLTPPAWSFTTDAGAGPQTITLLPSDVAANNGFSTAGGAWADILDGDDGDGSYAHACCGPAGQDFYVDLDDPSGLAGATIDSITVYVYARYLDGPWPGAVPYAGSLTIGYKTGTSTVWSNATTDTSGAYNLIQSASYTTDADGGTLDLTDINNLQIAVQRGVFGSPQLRVTQVYAEVVYTP